MFSISILGCQSMSSPAHMSVLIIGWRQILLRKGTVHDSTCLSCCTGPEDMLHLLVTWPKLVNFKSDLIDILHNVLLTDKHHTIIDYQELILHEYMKNTRTINTCFISFNVYSVVRLIIYKSRQIMVFVDKEIDTNKLFLFTMHKYVHYVFTYYKMNNRIPLFIKYSDVDNPLIRFSKLFCSTIALK